MRDRGGGLRSVPVLAESARFETFIAKPKPRSIPSEYFDAGARGVAENEEMAAGGIHPEATGDDAIEAFEALAHVSGTGDDEDAGGRGERDHTRAVVGADASKWSNSASRAACRWMITGPSGRSSSRRRSPTDRVAGSAKSSTTRGGSDNSERAAARARW